MPQKIFIYFILAFINATNVFAQANTQDNRIKIWLSFTDPNQYMRIIGLGYIENTTHDYDNGYDARAFNDNKNEMYWVMNNHNLCIMALPEFDKNETLPLGFNIYTSGNFTIKLNKLENLPENINIYLKDNETNLSYNLSETPAEIWINETIDVTRFSISYQEKNALLNVDSKENIENINLTYLKNNAVLKINNVESNAIKQLAIYNTSGKSVLNIKNNITSHVSINALKNGIYILNLETAMGTKRFKFIKH
ncbi:T9SS type A sorting domain-containing protein [Tamlana sp. 62-3]|uniref:T9SS type A sorting domain-containing protein n=1 Tax=Neotamlana sargassicola TaxID=2883125 RepID=A0A9X1I6L7_9FLAO|nr:T9SS type A sorting domain-containing protein [Tamlana sargassicola]MCB4808418.1 T9SS type A sorting domain-containing protein [Tamlana sargassicola]